MKKYKALILIRITVIFLTGCGSVNEKEEIFLLGKWTVSDGIDTAIQEWKEDGTILLENGVVCQWRKQGEDEPIDTQKWKAAIPEYDNSQTYFQVVDGEDLVKYIVVPTDDNSYSVISEVAYSGTTKTFVYKAYED